MSDIPVADKSSTSGTHRKFWDISEKIVIPLALAAFAYYGKKTSDQITAAQVQVAKLALERQTTESNAMLQLKYVELFYKDIQDPNPQKRQASISLLAAMQPGVAEMVARTVAADPAATQQVKQQVNDTLTAAQRFGPLSTYRLVIYYEKSAERDAQEIKSKLANAGFVGRIDLSEHGREFITDAAAYGYHVRYDDPVEHEAAEYLMSALRDALPREQFRAIPIADSRPKSDGVLTIFLFCHR